MSYRQAATRVDRSKPVQSKLRGSNVHQDQIAIHCPCRAFVAQQSTNNKVLGAITQRQADLAARCETESLREFLGKNDGGGIDQQIEKLPGAGFALLALKLQQTVVTKQTVGKNVDSQHA